MLYKFLVKFKLCILTQKAEKTQSSFRKSPKLTRLSRPRPAIVGSYRVSSQTRKKEKTLKKGWNYLEEKEIAKLPGRGVDQLRHREGIHSLQPVELPVSCVMCARFPAFVMGLALVIQMSLPRVCCCKCPSPMFL